MNIIILYNASTYQNLTGQILHCSVRSFHLLRQDASGQPIFRYREKKFLSPYNIHKTIPMVVLVPRCSVDMVAFVYEGLE